MAAMCPLPPSAVLSTGGREQRTCGVSPPPFVLLLTLASLHVASHSWQPSPCTHHTSDLSAVDHRCSLSPAPRLSTPGAFTCLPVMSGASSVSPLLRELDVSVVERDVNAYLARHPSLSTSRSPAAISLASLLTPDSPLAASALAYSHSQLDPVMFNHSCRVYYIGQAMSQHLNATSSYHVDAESYYLTSLLHDLGVGPHHLSTTRLSFEFAGAILAREFIPQPIPHLPSLG